MNKPRIIGVNGILNFSWSEDSFTDKVLGGLSYEFDVYDVKYPLMTALLGYSSFAISRRAKALYNQSRPGDVVIAHSFGCLLVIEAMKMGAQYSQVFFFGAAAECDTALTDEGFGIIYNIHSRDDRALYMGNMLPLHKFGCLGKDGYTGPNPRVLNIEGKPGTGHGGYISTSQICYWIGFIQRHIYKFWNIPITQDGQERAS
ncbi:MAG TPA: hypothetical protein VD999_07860 [Vitreimonas sp.]|nr:hypothetical protein [Vitreimonas sp.]